MKKVKLCSPRKMFTRQMLCAGVPLLWFLFCSVFGLFVAHCCSAIVSSVLLTFHVVGLWEKWCCFTLYSPLPSISLTDLMQRLAFQFWIQKAVQTLLSNAVSHSPRHHNSGHLLDQIKWSTSYPWWLLEEIFFPFQYIQGSPVYCLLLWTDFFFFPISCF